MRDPDPEMLQARGSDGRIQEAIWRDVMVACIAAGDDPRPATAAEIAQRMPCPGDHRLADVITGAEVPAPQNLGACFAEAAALARLPDQVVAAALQSLPLESRLQLYLADIVGLAYQEIAGITGIPLDAVAARLHRGRSRLRERLATLATRK
jgi:DNA-directed RNA polymerase specialized sigma24 family protein